MKRLLFIVTARMAKKELVSELTESEFTQVINEKKSPLIIVDFFAEWCMPCQMMAPIIARLAEKNPKAKFCKINVDNAAKLSDEYEISTIPCIIFFKDGKEIDRIAEAVGEEKLSEKVRDYLKL